MGLMAGMLPGVEFARRRRLRAVVLSAEAPCSGTSLGMYAAGNGHGHAAAGFPKRSGVCEEMMTMQLDSNAREAKERLDQKLRSQRESVVKRYLRNFFRATQQTEFRLRETLCLKSCAERCPDRETYMNFSHQQLPFLII
ncbi:hypothetical protein ACQ4PT_022417 [Festuca glaucescens]